MSKYTKLTAAFKAITIDATLLNSKLLNAELLNAKNIIVETGYNQLSDIVSYIKEKDNEVSSKFVESTYTVEKDGGNSGNVVLFIVPCDAYPQNVPFSRMSVPVTSGVPQMETGGETTPVYLGVILWNADGTKEIYGISDNQVTCNKFSTATWNFDTKPIVFTNDYRLIFYFIANREDFTTTEPTVYKDKIKITTRLHPTLDNIDPYYNWSQALTDLRLGWICNDSLRQGSSYPNWPACTFTTSKLTEIFLTFPNILSTVNTHTNLIDDLYQKVTENQDSIDDLDQGLEGVTNNLNTHIGDSTHLTTAQKNTISECENLTYTTILEDEATASGEFDAAHFKYQDVPHDFSIKKFILKPLESKNTPLYMAVWTLTQSGQKTYVGLSDEAITWEAGKDAVWTFNNVELIVPENHNVEFFLCTGADAVGETNANAPGVYIKTKYNPSGRGTIRYANGWHSRCVQATFSNNGYLSHVGDGSHLTSEQKNAIKDYLSHVGDDSHLTTEQKNAITDYTSSKNSFATKSEVDSTFATKLNVDSTYAKNATLFGGEHRTATGNDNTQSWSAVRIPSAYVPHLQPIHEVKLTTLNTNETTPMYLGAVAISDNEQQRQLLKLSTNSLTWTANSEVKWEFGEDGFIIPVGYQLELYLVANESDFVLPVPAADVLLQSSMNGSIGVGKLYPVSGTWGGPRLLDCILVTKAHVKDDTHLTEEDRELLNNFSNGYFVIDSLTNGTNWYRKYSDGWIEQGGLVGTGTTSYTLTFNTAFSNTNYTFIAQDTAATNTDSDTGGWGDQAGVSNYTTTSVRLSKQSGRQVSWYACGY